MTIDPLSHVVGFKSVISHRFKHIQSYSLCRTAAHGSTNSNGFLLFVLTACTTLTYDEICGNCQPVLSWRDAEIASPGRQAFARLLVASPGLLHVFPFQMNRSNDSCCKGFKWDTVDIIHMVYII